MADRIASGPIPLDEALPLAAQIAEAVEYAHDHNVVHRDLKPANVKITPQGAVKVLDFGLAKALADEPDFADPRNSPTLTMTAATRMGVVLGTAAYMAPEQAKGKPVDRRADIWAFGVMLYEMLSGQPLHHGETVAETMASVIFKEVKLDGLPADRPPAIKTLLRRCLEKDPKQRLQAIGEARILLRNPMPPAADPAPPPVSRCRNPLVEYICYDAVDEEDHSVPARRAARTSAARSLLVPGQHGRADSEAAGAETAPDCFR